MTSPSTLSHPPKTIDVLGFGEPMMELSSVTRNGENVYLPGLGGDTSNATVAAARQGAKCAFFTGLGADAFGREFLKLWDDEGIDRSTVITRQDGRTGVYFITHGPSGHEFSYARAGSAASLVTSAELPLNAIAAARVLHLSGISQGISTTACDAVFDAMKHARATNTTVSYDTNLRLRLWPLERARAIILSALTMSDIALPGLEDAQQLTGLDRPEDICAHHLALGCKIVALTMGKDGTMLATPDRCEMIPARVVQAIDATGAGDTFDGAFLSEWLRTQDPFAAAAYANAAAALSTQKFGAVASIPTRAATERFIAGA